MDLEYGLGLKKSMFDELARSLLFFSPVLPYEKAISEFQLYIEARRRISEQMVSAQIYIQILSIISQSNPYRILKLI
jgi:hypothetical protein